MSNHTTSIQLDNKTTYKLNNGLEIPISGLSLKGLDASKVSDSVTEALESGVRHIDSAEFEQEAAQSVAKFLKKSSGEVTRDDIWFSTKISASKLGYDSTLKELSEISKRVESEIGHVDLVILETNKDIESVKSSWRALQEAVCKQNSEVKAIGLANIDIKPLQEFLSWDGLLVKPTVNQLDLNPWRPCFDLRQVSLEHSILLETTSPLSKLDSDTKLLELSKKYKTTPTDILIKWSFLQGLIVLVATANTKLIKEVSGLLPKVEVEDDQLEEVKSYGKIDLDLEILEYLKNPSVN